MMRSERAFELSNGRTSFLPTCRLDSDPSSRPILQVWAGRPVLLAALSLSVASSRWSCKHPPDGSSTASRGSEPYLLLGASFSQPDRCCSPPPGRQVSSTPRKD